MKKIPPLVLFDNYFNCQKLSKQFKARRINMPVRAFNCSCSKPHERSPVCDIIECAIFQQTFKCTHKTYIQFLYQTKKITKKQAFLSLLEL